VNLDSGRVGGLHRLAAHGVAYAANTLRCVILVCYAHPRHVQRTGDYVARHTGRLPDETPAAESLARTLRKTGLELHGADVVAAPRPVPRCWVRIPFRTPNALDPAL